MPVPMIALQPHHYGGHQIKRGDAFTCRNAAEARVLVALKHAEHAPTGLPGFVDNGHPPSAGESAEAALAALARRQPEPDPTTVAPEKEGRLRRYRRRDLEAEGTSGKVEA